MAERKHSSQGWLDGEQWLTRFYTKNDKSTRSGMQRGDHRAAMQPQLTTSPPDSVPDHAGEQPTRA